MSIEKIGVGYVPARKQTTNNAKNAQPRTYQGGAKDSVSFGALSSKEISKILDEGLVQKSTIKFMEKFKTLKGELGGILLTAIGTGAVAPIFIGFNPFVKPPKNATKEEKEDLANTKLYTAMRQPISAGLAILFQASILKYIDKALDLVFNVPTRANFMGVGFNRSRINTDTYLKTLVARQLKEEGIEKPSTLFSKAADRKAYKEKFNERLEKIKEDQLQKVADDFLKDSKIQLGQHELDNKTIAELINKNIENYKQDSRLLQKTPEAIAEYLDKADLLQRNKEAIREMFNENVIPLEEIEKTNKTIRNITLRKEELELFKEELSQAFKTPEDKIHGLLKDLHEKTSDDELKSIIDECLTQPKAMQEAKKRKILERINVLCENYEKELDAPKAELKRLFEVTKKNVNTQFLQDLYKNTQNVELRSLINECLIRPKDLQANHALRILERINCIDDMCKNDYSREAYAKALEAKNAVLDKRIRRLCEVKIKNPAEASTPLIEKTINILAEICTFKKDGSVVESVLRDTDVYGHSTSELKKKIAKDVAKSYKKLTEHHYTCFNQVSKIFVGVFITLPITCTALNWVYPRFMEIFFPKLAGVKKTPPQQSTPQQNKVGGDK